MTAADAIKALRDAITAERRAAEEHAAAAYASVLQGMTTSPRLDAARAVLRGCDAATDDAIAALAAVTDAPALTPELRAALDALVEAERANEAAAAAFKAWLLGSRSKDDSLTTAQTDIAWAPVVECGDGQAPARPLSGGRRRRPLGRGRHAGAGMKAPCKRALLDAADALEHAAAHSEDCAGPDHRGARNAQIATHSTPHEHRRIIQSQRDWRAVADYLRALARRVDRGL